MNPYTHRFRQESLKVAGIAAVCVVIVVAVAVWRTSDSDGGSNIDAIDVELVSWVNGERVWNGINPIPIDGDLANQAELQASRMAVCNCLYHSPRGELGWWLERGWFEVAENVGVTSGAGVHALFGLHLRFVASAPHRANMLDTRHDAVGVAVGQSADGRLFVVQFFGGL